MSRETYPSIPFAPFPVCDTARVRFRRPRLLPQVPNLGAGPVRCELPRPVRDTVRTPLTLLYVQVPVCQYPVTRNFKTRWWSCLASGA